MLIGVPIYLIGTFNDFDSKKNQGYLCIFLFFKIFTKCGGTNPLIDKNGQYIKDSLEIKTTLSRKESS